MTPSPEPDELSIRVTVACEPATSRARAEQIARSIERFAEQRPGVSHVYELEVYNVDDLVEPDDA